MTKDEIENRRAFLRGITDPDTWVNELCDLAILGATARDVWYSEYFQPSAELNHRAWRDFEIAKREWIAKASEEERKKLEYRGRRYANLPT